MAGLLAGELGQYVTAAAGLAEARVVRHHAAQRGAPVFQAMAGTVRLMVGELVVVEWFRLAWPGLPAGGDAHPGRVCLGVGGVAFLDPPLVASILTISPSSSCSPTCWPARLQRWPTRASGRWE